MKIRNGFVSNSSSSSFVCDISGHVESGWDIGLEDAGMVGCENGHVFTEDYLTVSLTDIEEEITEEQGEEPDDLRYCLPAKYCPICQMHHLPDAEIVGYLLRKSPFNRKEMMEAIRNEFSSYEDFQKYIKGKNA